MATRLDPAQVAQQRMRLLYVSPLDNDLLLAFENDVGERGYIYAVARTRYEDEAELELADFNPLSNSTVALASGLWDDGELCMLREAEERKRREQQERFEAQARLEYQRLRARFAPDDLAERLQHESRETLVAALRKAYPQAVLTPEQELVLRRQVYENLKKEFGR